MNSKLQCPNCEKNTSGKNYNHGKHEIICEHCLFSIPVRERSLGDGKGGVIEINS